MRDRLDHLWRVGGTGVAFASFGLGGGLLAVTVFPMVALFARSTETAHRRVRYIIHLVFRLFVLFVRGLGIIDVTIEGRERLSDCRGCLIVANHPTLIDVVLLMSLMPRIQCVVKQQLWKNFFLRGVVSAAGFVRNDLPADELLQQCKNAFSQGENLLVFPEGTRTIPGVFPRFLRGFANIAILSQADIQLVVIKCNPVQFTRDEPWYSVPQSRPSFTVRVDDRWEGATYNQTPHRALNARKLVRNLETYYQDALSNG